jgi:hypothetical protein
MSGVPEASTSAAASKRVRVEEGITQETIDSLSRLASDLQYAAMNIVGIRAEVKRVTKGNSKDLLQLLVGLTTLGSKFTRRAAKASNPEVARGFVTKLSTLQITETRATPVTLTGPRVLMAHAPLVLRLRKMLRDERKLSSPGVPTETPVELCEPALASLSDEYPEMKDFLEQFAMVLNDDAIKNNKPNKKANDQLAVDAMHQIRRIAVDNHKMDPLYAGVDLRALTIGQWLGVYGYT